MGIIHQHIGKIIEANEAGVAGVAGAAKNIGVGGKLMKLSKSVQTGFEALTA